jgi:N utilization substance protein A
MAAQTAKQVIIQRLREAERNILYQNYKEKEGKIMNGVVQKREGRNILVDLDRVTAIMPPDEQIHFEKYNTGNRVKVVLLAVNLTSRGPELIVSRAHPLIVQKLFESEIPEIANGAILVKAVAREAGARSKVAVFTPDEGVDPIGSCIGQRGSRIQTIIAELGGEKVDVIEWSDKPEKFIANALLPAKVLTVETNAETKEAIVTVPAEQLSLTIGREGQNVRLAVRLTGWKINIREKGREPEPKIIPAVVEEKIEETKEEKKGKKMKVKKEKVKKVEKEKKVKKKETN